MKKLNKFLTLLIGIVLYEIMLVQNAWAEEYVSVKSGLDVIFVMDYSGSMKSNDPDAIAQGMVKAFIDTVHATDIHVGFVAYNDQLLAATQPLPVKTNEERQTLKTLIDKSGYSGNTDIGLGLRYAYDLIRQNSDRKKAIILISDGESDLKGSSTGRVLENALQDVEYVTSECKKEAIPVYSIAFGEYDGNVKSLEKISGQTGGEMYTVKKPETLIQVLYGIFENNMDYRIEKITDGIYAAGRQDILVKLDEPYVDEVDVLLISPQTIGSVEVIYGEKEAETILLKNYAVAKLENIDEQIKELVVRTETVKNQELQVYLIAYRNLTPVLLTEPLVDKNSSLTYQVYFKDKNETIITDEAFYHHFFYTFALSKKGEKETLEAEIQNGRICGEVILNHTGTYFLEGRLDDHMGKVVFPTIEIQVQNRCPEGELPVNERYTILTKEQMFPLDEYFSDPDGDNLTYALKESLGNTEKKPLQAELNDGILRIKPVKSGKGIVELNVTDGEAIFTYIYEAEVIPLWKVYWWVIVLLAVLCAVLFWKFKHKAKPELKQLVADTRKNQFCGKLDAYFTVQPETEEEILPLSFSMIQFTDNKLSLDLLFKAYPEAIEALELDAIYLVADEERRMVLYHNSRSSVMIGNAIACKEIQYSVSFGDVIYITSPDNHYDLELHYIAVIQ